jgi:fatty acid desaturase
MVDQEYQPYRSVLLSKGELAELNRLNFGRAVRDITWLWLQIITAWGIAAFQPRWWIIVLAAAFVGNRYYSLFIIGHDGLHRRLHPRQGVNDLVNDLFVLGPLAAITRINRRNHMRHHGTLACADDPDTYKYQPRWRVGPLAFLFSITGVPFVFRAIKNVYSGNAETAVTTSPRHALYRHWVADFALCDFDHAIRLVGLSGDVVAAGLCVHVRSRHHASVLRTFF